MIQIKKVIDAIVRCRTAALGGHRDQCLRCGHQAISYNSCRNRHCPKCQGNARAKWLAARSAELLPVPYFHIVFTLPHELSALVLQNKRGCSTICSTAPALHDARTGSRSEAPGCRRRIPRRAPYLGRIFLTAVWALDLKALVFDVFAKASGCDETPSPAAH
jgi:hypothetical protein